MKKDKKLIQQYDNFSDTFSVSQVDYNRKSNKKYFEFINQLNLENKKILDLGCGDGTELEKFESRGSLVGGVDSSCELVEIAKEKGLDVTLGSFEKMKFKNNFFDVVTSKYALQTVHHLEKTYDEVNRVLKKGGIFYFMVVHPFRQFIEKKDKKANYFEKTVVNSVLFDGTITVEEPTHTMSEYINSKVLENFDLVVHEEGEDFISAEQIEGKRYPTYLIIGLKKK